MDAGHVQIGLIQMTCDESPERNLEKAAARVEEAANRGAQVVCLQELYRSQYLCQSEDNALFDLAEPIPGPSTKTLGRVAAARKIAIVAPIFERRAPGVYHNSAVVIDESGRVAGHYRKMHIPDDPGYYEKFYFTPGDLDFITHGTEKASVGVLICWDQWFPEAARLTALAGAQMLFYPTAIGWTSDMSQGSPPASSRGMGDDPAIARDRQRGLRRGGQPGWCRGRDRVLGRLVRRRSVRRSDLARGPMRRKRLWSSIAI